MTKTQEVNSSLELIKTFVTLNKKEEKAIKLILNIMYSRANAAGRLEVLNKIS